MDKKTLLPGIKSERGELFSTAISEEKKEEDFSYDNLGWGIKYGDIKLPDINLNTGQQEQQEQAPQQEQEAQEQEAEDPFNIDIKLPEIDIKLPGVKIEAPDIDLGLPEITLPNIGLPDIDLDPFKIIPKMANMNDAFDDLDIDFGVDLQPIKDEVDEKIQETAETVKEAVDPVLEYIGEATKPVSEFVKDVTDPIVNTVNEKVKEMSSLLGETSEYLSEHTHIRQGDGSGYGEVKIGDGIVLDTSEMINETYDSVTKDTILEGTNAKDVFELATDPNEFLKNKATDVASDTLSKSFGLEKDFSSDIVGAITNPEQFIQNKGEQVVTDFVSSVTGVDSGVIGTVGKLAQAKDVGQAAEIVVRQAATNTTVNTVANVAMAINPILGAAVHVIAAVSRYRCYLTTACYESGLLTKKQYLMFPKYRTRIQRNSPLGTMLWIGYLNYAQIFSFFMKRNKLFLNIVYVSIVKQWLRYIEWRMCDKKFSIKGFLAVQILMRLLSTISFFLFFPISILRLIQMKNIDAKSIYRKTIREVEYGRAI